MSHILEVDGLTTVFKGDGGEMTSADRVSFYVDPGEVVCIVGESGCGKSVTALSIMGLLGKGGSVKSGRALYEPGPGEAPVDLLALSENQLDHIRGNQVTMIFQDPLTSLNPVFTIGRQLTESIRIHMGLDRAAAQERATSFLRRVGMPDPVRTMKKYPHMLSGGQRQRVMIAMALCCSPRLLIADEPTTALDVTIQAQIMELLRQLQKELGMAVILITHDIGLVAQMADRVMVMYAGQMIEQANVLELFDHPRHPYTQALLRSVPSIPFHQRGEDGGMSAAACCTSGQRLESIRGTVPEHYDRIEGCRFADRCPYAQDRCHQPQQPVACSSTHWARCWRAEKGGETG